MVEACPSPHPFRMILVAWLFFAVIYQIMHAWSSKHFGFDDPFVDSLYFSMTTTTTTGFGDISPKTPAARLVVTLHQACMVGLVGWVFCTFR